MTGAVWSNRAKALALYRKLLRSARTWPGPNSEKRYIRDEAVIQFRLNQHLTDQEEIGKKIFEGESRHDIAWHYKIPYPRLHNFPTGSLREKPSRGAAPNFEVPSEEMGSLDDRKPTGYRGGWAKLSMS